MAKRQARQMTLQPGQGGLGERTVGGGLGASSQLGGNGSVGGISFFSFHWTIGYERDRKLLVCQRF